MKNLTQVLPESCLKQWGFYLCPPIKNLNLEGNCYQPAAELGEGYYWYYEREGK